MLPRRMESLLNIISLATSSFFCPFAITWHRSLELGASVITCLKNTRVQCDMLVRADTGGLPAGQRLWVREQKPRKESAYRSVPPPLSRHHHHSQGPTDKTEITFSPCMFGIFCFQLKFKSNYKMGWIDKGDHLYYLLYKSPFVKL